MSPKLHVRNETEKNAEQRRAVALVTGASSGIGQELARLFARDGYDLVLVARNHPRLEHLAAALRSEHHVQATLLVQDLAEPNAAQVIFDAIERLSIRVDALVNDAGTQVYGEFAEQDVNKQADLPIFKERKP